MRLREARTIPSMLFRICLLVCFSLMLMSSAKADQNSRLFNLFAEYEDTKEDLLVELVNADRMRKQDRKIDSHSIQHLATEGFQLLHEAGTLYDDGKMNAKHHPAQAGALQVLYALKVACDALYQTAFNELEYESGEKSAFILTVRAKYEDLLRTADAELRRVMVQQNFSMPPAKQDARR